MHWGASAAFYALISLPALLVLLASVVNLLAPDADLELVPRLAPLLSRDGIEVLNGVLDRVSEIGFSSLRTIPSVMLLAISGTAVFVNLQTAMNEIWDIEPQGHPVSSVLRARLVSLLTASALGMVLFVSFLFTAGVQGLARVAEESFLGSLGIIRLLDPLASLVVYWILFALLFCILPDARVNWKDVLAGAWFTALLFVAGKEGVAFYLANTDAGSAYGAAGSVLLFLLWVYYSFQLVFLGAVFTRVYSEQRGRLIRLRS